MLHVATCKLLSEYGYYKFDSIDKDGWPLNSGFNMGQRGGKGSSYEGGKNISVMFGVFSYK